MTVGSVSIHVVFWILFNGLTCAATFIVSDILNAFFERGIKAISNKALFLLVQLETAIIFLLFYFKDYRLW
jgi:Na+-driven multidrug efflux pump